MRYVFLGFVTLLLAYCFFAPVGSAVENTNAVTKAPAIVSSTVTQQQFEKWIEAGEGLFYAFIEEDAADVFVIVKINPQLYRFTLHMASEAGESFPLVEWAQKNNLLAAINASMYLPDKVTSTGHMQSGTHVNNSHIGTNFGAFFVAEPADPSLPLVDIIERNTPNWESTLASYSIRVQNFRIIDTDKNVRWAEQSKKHSIAAIGKDEQGCIYFMLASAAISVPEFAQRIQNFLPEMSSVMYVEGSDKAALYLNAEAQYLWQGRKSLFNIQPATMVHVPNVLGIVTR